MEAGVACRDGGGDLMVSRDVSDKAGAEATATVDGIV